MFRYAFLGFHPGCRYWIVFSVIVIGLCNVMKYDR